MPKLVAPTLPYVLLNDPLLVGNADYWRVDPPAEATHLLIGKLSAGGPHELNCNPGSVILVIAGQLNLTVEHPQNALPPVTLLEGDGYQFNGETRAVGSCVGEVTLLVLRAGGPGGHPKTNDPPRPN